MQGVHDRPAALLPDRAPLLGRAAADLGLDRVELADPAQRLLRQGRAGGLVDLVEAPPAMRPAEGEPDLARRPALQQALEAGIAVHLQHALELGQVGGRMLALAVLGVEVDHRRRGAAAPGPVIDRVAPQAGRSWSGPGRGRAPAGCVVGEDPGRAHHVPAQEAPQRLQPPAGPPDPVAQRGAVELDPLPGEDPGLAVQGQKIGVLGHQHVRQQRLGRHPAGDRPLRSGRLHHRLLAGPAAVAGAADHLHPQLGRDDVEHLARVLADRRAAPRRSRGSSCPRRRPAPRPAAGAPARRPGCVAATRGGRGVPLLAAASSCAASAAATVCSRSSRPSCSWSGSSRSERRPNRPRCSCRIKSRSFSISACAASRSATIPLARTVSCSACSDTSEAFCRATTSVICCKCCSSRSGSRGRSSSTSDMALFYWP